MKKQHKKQIISIFVCLNLIFSQSFLAADLPITPDSTKSPNLFIDQTANKVDIANIEAPINSVSHNVFKDFNINENGLIFNNSNSITSTKLGGVIYKNPNFSSHEANTIIAEISGTNKTHLLGFGEIAGKKADLIIANPNGIIANKAGFINTNNISFDTRSQDNSAKFEVLGEGIDLTNTNKAEILANLVELNAAIYGGNELQIKLENSSNLASNLEPQYALDAKAFGSMYAGKIKIIANNAGIGVRSNADIIAQDELIINSNGDLELANTKANIINLQSNSNIKLNDKVIADELNLNADKFTHDTAEFLVKNALNLNANELNINKEIITSANLNLNAPKISQNAFIFTLRDVGVNGDEIENTGDIWANNIFITANSQFINLAGMLHSNEDIFINAPIIQNQGVVSGDYSGVWASRKANEFYAKELAELERLKRTVCDDCALNSFGFKLLKRQLDAKIEAKKNEFVAQAININAFSQDYKDSINRRFDLMNDGWKGNFWAYDAQILQSDFTTNKATINARNNLNLIGNSIINQEADIFVGNDLNVQANKFANQREALIIKQGVTFAKVREYTDRTWYGKKKKRKTNEYINTTYDNVLYSDKPTNIFVGNDANIVAQNSFLNGDNANPAAFTIGENKTNEISIDLSKNPYLSKNPDKNSPYAYVINPKIIDLFAKNPEFGYTEVSNPFLSNPSLYAGSEYFLNKLGFESKNTDKFLASAELSSALLKQSLQANSAKKYLQNFDESIKELVDNAQSEYKRLNLTPFVSLSPEQVKSLKSDIIWYEYEYKNGSIYAVPKIYLSNETLSNIASTAISTKGNLNIKADEIISNDTINSDRSISLVGKNIHLNSDYRQASLNSAGDLNIIANDKFINKGTNLNSNQNINLHAKNLSISANVLKNINLATNQFSQIQGKGEIKATNINLNANDISINGANLTAKENINSNSKNLSIFGVQSFKKTQTGNYDNYTITQQIRNEAANLSAQNINLIADNEILVTGSNLNAQDELNLAAKDISITAGQNSDYSERVSIREGTFKTTSETTIKNDIFYSSSNLNANNINLISTNDISILGSNLNASNLLNLTANGSITQAGLKNQSYYYHDKRSVSWFGAQRKSLKDMQDIETAMLSNSLSNGDSIYSAKNSIILTGVNIKAKDKAEFSANQINITPLTFMGKTTHDQSNSGFDISKTFTNNLHQSITNQGSNLEANDLKMSADIINLQGSSLSATNAQINANELNLISSKNTQIDSTISMDSGVFVAKISSNGSVQEVEIPAIIQVENKFIFNGNDITDKLDTQTVQQVQNSLETQNIIKTLSSNSATSLNEDQINQIKATLNNDQWGDTTKTISGICGLIITAVVTYCTAGTGSAAAGAATTGATATATATATAAATTAITQAVTQALINALAIQTANYAVSGGKVKFDVQALAQTAAISALTQISNPASTYAASYISNSTLQAVSNHALQTIANSAISSTINGSSFRDTLSSNINSSLTNFAFNQVGNISMGWGLEDGDLTKASLHGLVGGFGAYLRGDSFTTGALSSAGVELMRPISSDWSDKSQLLASNLSGIFFGALLDGQNGANLASELSISSELNNRQMHKAQMDRIKELAQEYSNQTGMPLDEAIKFIAKASYALTDKSANEMYEDNLNLDEYNKFTNAMDFVKSKIDYSEVDFMENGEFSGVLWAKKSQYDDRYSNLIGFNEYESFYNDYLKINTQNPQNNSNFANGIATPYQQLGNAFVSHPLNTSWEILTNIFNPFSWYQSGQNLRQTYEMAQLDNFLGDYASASQHYGEFLGGVAPLAIGTAGGVAYKGVSYVGKNIEASALTKITDNLPKGYKFNTATGTAISPNGTRYAMNGVTDISGSPVWQQIGKQGSLTEQYFVFANNAKQQITKPQILKNGSQSMVWDSAYRIGNIATDPRTWIYGTAGVEIANDVLNDSTPPSTGYGTIGATIKDLFFSEESNIKKTFGIENER